MHIYIYANIQRPLRSLGEATANHSSSRLGGGGNLRGPTRSSRQQMFRKVGLLSAVVGRARDGTSKCACTHPYRAHEHMETRH